ncbi:aminotransferase class IV [Microbulbifer magnicolonia]|uniref:aminotransferase class IV n=1 Tax=Microbulbifer magnicolonia TaxID=3109744 RepID=UPI002B401F55|nr:aminotransferase class IV [Microbulbifer sp. GG15]
MTELPQFFCRGLAVASLPQDHVYDLGLLETMRCQHGSVPLWALHRARLQRGGHLSVALLAEVDRAVRKIAANCPSASAKLRLRWGLVDAEERWDLSLLPLEPTPELTQGARLFPCATRLESPDSANLGCKTLRRTRYNRARSELPAGEPTDGLLRDSRGWVIESLRCNLLARISGTWVTPDLSRCGVRGVMRDWIARHIELSEMNLDLESLCQADEVALCNSVRGVMPVTELIGYRNWPIGPETRKLQQLIAEELW